MQLTKFTHACVRIEIGGATIVIDPGVWAEPEALDGADAVLITHEHADHADAARLKGIGIPIHAPEGAVIDGVDYIPVAPGSTFDVAGVRVQALGARHALTYRDLPNCANFGYLLDGVYHPGDALALPETAVETLLVPIDGPWVCMGDLIEFVRAVTPARAFPIHEALLNDRGIEFKSRWIADQSGTDYRVLRSGETA